VPALFFFSESFPTSGIRANELSQMICLVRMRTFNAAHFVQDHWNAEIGRLPGGF